MITQSWFLETASNRLGNNIKILGNKKQSQQAAKTMWCGWMLQATEIVLLKNTWLFLSLTYFMKVWLGTFLPLCLQPCTHLKTEGAVLCSNPIRDQNIAYIFERAGYIAQEFHLISQPLWQMSVPPWRLLPVKREGFLPTITKWFAHTVSSDCCGFLSNTVGSLPYNLKTSLLWFGTKFNWRFYVLCCYIS